MKTYLAIFLLTCLASVTTCTQESVPQVVPLWQNGAPGGKTGAQMNACNAGLYGTVVRTGTLVRGQTVWLICN